MRTWPTAQAVEAAFASHRPQRVVHLAAQAGVRYAAQNPHVYVSSNVTGFLHVLEGCRHHGVEHLVFASTSSVYGANTTMPFSEHQSTDHPLTLVRGDQEGQRADGAQLCASVRHRQHRPALLHGLRPVGTPGHGAVPVHQAILAGEPIQVFNHGRHKRSFTYIDDIVDGVVRALDHVPARDDAWRGDAPDPASSGVAPYRLYNIGSRESVELLRYIEVLEAVPGPQGDAGTAAAAARRRAGHRGRLQRPDPRHGLCAAGDRRGRRRQLRATGTATTSTSARQCRRVSTPDSLAPEPMSVHWRSERAVDSRRPLAHRTDDRRRRHKSKRADDCSSALCFLCGAPGEIRTPDHQVRSLVLYPAELRALQSKNYDGSISIRQTFFEIFPADRFACAKIRRSTKHPEGVSCSTVTVVPAIAWRQPFRCAVRRACTT